MKRRMFLRNSLCASTALAFGTKMISANASQSNDSFNNLSGGLSAQSIAFMKMMDIKYPIIQAPAAGPATQGLIRAVATKGALGGLPLTWHRPEDAFTMVKELQNTTTGSFFANYVLNFEPKSLDKALEAGVKTIQFSWGLPSKDIIAKIRKAGAMMGIQVTSEANAKAAVKLGADYLVCQGTEAGGHVHASRPLAEALDRVLAVSGNVPVAASGGIATGKDMAKYLNLGAAAVVMGSRFVATKESNAHAEYKDALVQAKSEDTVFTVCLNSGWSNATHRILRNGTFENWEAAGCPQVGKRPGEGDVIATRTNGNNIIRYSGTPPTVGLTGNVADTAMYAGKGVDSIDDIPSASEVIDRVWNEFLSSV